MKGTVFPRPSVKDPDTGARRPVRGSTWTYQFAVLRGDKRRQINKGGFATKRAAEVAMREAIGAHAGGTHVEPSKMTVTVYLRTEWLPLQEAARKPSTYHGYEHIVERRIIPALGDHRLSELTSGDIAGLVDVGGRAHAREDGVPLTAPRVPVRLFANAQGGYS